MQFATSVGQLKPVLLRLCLLSRAVALRPGGKSRTVLSLFTPSFVGLPGDLDSACFKGFTANNLMM